MGGGHSVRRKYPPACTKLSSGGWPRAMPVQELQSRVIKGCAGIAVPAAPVKAGLTGG
jgi:hypothetical protein